LLAICGSTKKSSSNLTILRFLQARYNQDIEFSIYTALEQLPIFNPDQDNEKIDPAVAEFRSAIAAADAVLISTPEYAMGVPGGLKNALDWTVSSMEFSKKITGLITASTSGTKAHQSLIETLIVIEANIPEERRVLISYINAKLKGDVILDETALAAVDRLMNSMISELSGT